MVNIFKSVPDEDLEKAQNIKSMELFFTCFDFLTVEFGVRIGLLNLTSFK